MTFGPPIQSSAKDPVHQVYLKPIRAPYMAYICMARTPPAHVITSYTNTFSRGAVAVIDRRTVAMVHVSSVASPHPDSDITRSLRSSLRRDSASHLVCVCSVGHPVAVDGPTRGDGIGILKPAAHPALCHATLVQLMDRVSPA